MEGKGERDGGERVKGKGREGGRGERDGGERGKGERERGREREGRGERDRGKGREGGRGKGKGREGEGWREKGKRREREGEGRWKGKGGMESDIIGNLRCGHLLLILYTQHLMHNLSKCMYIYHSTIDTIHPSGVQLTMATSRRNILR